jgi:general secretion pathway protein C
MGKAALARHVMIAAYLSTIAFVLAHATNAYVADWLYQPLDQETDAPAQETPEASSIEITPQEDSETILRSGLFELPPSGNGPTAKSAAAPPPPPLEVGKKLALLGTVSGQEGGVMAVLEDMSTKQQSLYRLGSQVPEVATLAAIEKNRVLFRDGAREEWLELALTKQGLEGASVTHVAPARAAAAQPQRRVLDRREITAALNDPTRLLTQALAVPYLTDGKLDGFRLANVMPLGLFDKLGLQANDILQRINGVELRDPGMVLGLMKQLQNERTVRVDLVRNSQRQTLTYDIR